jgi:hypothetical protein
MKFLSTLLLIGLVSYMVSAHSGRTDSSGGHHNRKDGGYHYHHGRPAHDHYEGHCPYDASGDLFLLSGLEAVIVFAFLKIRDKIKRA